MSNEIQKTATAEVYTDLDKLRAAYALNMCNVSVSQIVEYKDSRILDQEYDTILNNLNLEQIPKDEALLRILVELLNTITFFRVQERKKDHIEQHYQHQMKNAIWSAVPNLFMVFSSKKPIGTMLLSLATQVGIGYMNYRRVRAEARAENDDKLFDLQITAIEQFNALRRELFTTAWRLADKYNFPDRYRLTEKQIAQYNEILEDADDLRKFARMEAIQDKFEAYPQFWYHMAHTACYIAQNRDVELDCESREYYYLQAKTLFEKYFELNRFNILREDHITASAVLEYADLLLLDSAVSEETKKNVTQRLDESIGMAGNANDILQLFAIAYLRCGAPEQAADILKNLVNENYNALTNAKILSRLYVSQYLYADDTAAHRIHAQYNTLKLRVNEAYLFPLPERKSDDANLMEEYIHQQKSLLLRDFRFVLKAFANSQKNDYEAQLQKECTGLTIIAFLDGMLSTLDKLYMFGGHENKDLFEELILDKIYEKEHRKALQENKKIPFEYFVDEFFEIILSACTNYVDNMESVQEIEKAYLDLVSFCSEDAANINLPQPVRNLPSPIHRASDTCGLKHFDAHKILSKEASPEQSAKQQKAKMKEVFKGYKDYLVKRSAKNTVLLTDGQDLMEYFSTDTLRQWRTDVFAVIADRTHQYGDFWLAVDGYAVVRDNYVVAIEPYTEPTRIKNEFENYIKLGIVDTYENNEVDLTQLANLIKRLAATQKSEV